jgi:inorganic pyrophosphatase
MGEEQVVVIVEIPTGSRNKYEFDAELDAIVLDRMLFTATRYPADYGYIEGTLGEDGDPLDALVFVGEPTFPGCRIRARPVGLFKMRDEKGNDEKILCVPLRDPMWSHVENVNDLLPTLRAEIQHFFEVYKDLEGKETSTEGFGERETALEVIASARRRIIRGSAFCHSFSSMGSSHWTPTDRVAYRPLVTKQGWVFGSG